MRKVFEFSIGVICLIGGILYLRDFDASYGIKSIAYLLLSFICFFGAYKWLHKLVNN